MQLHPHTTLCCRLTDPYGRILNPCQPGSIGYTVLSAENIQTAGTGIISSGAKIRTARLTDVAVWFYLSVFADDKCITEPIPVSLRRTVLLVAPEQSDLSFKPSSFVCRTVPFVSCGQQELFSLAISVELFTVVRAVKDGRPLDCFGFRCACCFYWQIRPLSAAVYQYNAAAGWDQRLFTDQDELKEYGSQGIPAPESVSFYQLFINGVLQPQINYRIRQGALELLTRETPPVGAPVILRLVTLQNSQKWIVENRSYYARSDGVKTVFTREDGWKGCSWEIPDLEAVTAYWLYVNGVLQPNVNYRVQNGLLILLTDDVPPPGAMIILEWLSVTGENHILRWGETAQYSAAASETMCYTAQDAVPMYGPSHIPAAENSTCQLLSVNSVIQPKVNYTVQEGWFVLNTEEAPLRGSPLTLQTLWIY